MAPATISDLRAAPLLDATDLALRRGRQWLIRDLSFQVRVGQLVWVQGANGSGKTTLLRASVGLTPLAAGRIVKDVQAGNPLFLGHQLALKDDLRARDALEFLLALRGVEPAPAAIAAALDRLRVRHVAERSVRTLSQGQRRRIALCRLLLEPQARLWVLDEPMDALDAAGVDLVLQILDTHLQTGGAVLMTSHVPVTLANTVVQEVRIDATPRPDPLREAAA